MTVSQKNEGQATPYSIRHFPPMSLFDVVTTSPDAYHPMAIREAMAVRHNVMTSKSTSHAHMH